eukprot:scaffold210194_cov39-Tisochrysis_lutea.AAC.1
MPHFPKLPRRRFRSPEDLADGAPVNVERAEVAALADRAADAQAWRAPGSLDAKHLREGERAMGSMNDGSRGHGETSTSDEAASKDDAQQTNTVTGSGADRRRRRSTGESANGA